MKPPTRTATTEERELAAKIGRLFRAGNLDDAADLLATELEATYWQGYIDGDQT